MTPTTAPDQLAAALEDPGCALAVMPAGLDPIPRAAWLAETCRALDLVAAQREGVIVGAHTAGDFPALPDAEIVFVAFREDFDVDEWARGITTDGPPRRPPPD